MTTTKIGQRGKTIKKDNLLQWQTWLEQELSPPLSDALRSAKFKVRDVVEYINEHEVHIGRRRIAAIDDSKEWSDNEPRYFLAPTDTPWYSVRERYLHAAPSAH